MSELYFTLMPQQAIRNISFPGEIMTAAPETGS
jgi:hypothetical protein